MEVPVRKSRWAICSSVLAIESQAMSLRCAALSSHDLFQPILGVFRTSLGVIELFNLKLIWWGWRIHLEVHAWSLHQAPPPPMFPCPFGWLQRRTREPAA